MTCLPISPYPFSFSADIQWVSVVAWACLFRSHHHNTLKFSPVPNCFSARLPSLVSTKTTYLLFLFLCLIPSLSNSCFNFDFQFFFYSLSSSIISACLFQPFQSKWTRLSSHSASFSLEFLFLPSWLAISYTYLPSYLLSSFLLSPHSLNVYIHYCYWQCTACLLFAF